MALRRKSGDSKLQDAEKARELEHKHSSEMDANDTLESSIDETQDAEERAKMAGATPDEAAEVREMMKQMGLTIIGLQKKIETLEGTSATLSAARSGKQGRVYLKCPTCQQVTPGVCNGNHINVFVAPSQMDMYPMFQGVTVNGVTYAGACLIPETIQHTVLSQARRWEARERKKFIPGGKVLGSLDSPKGMTQPSMFG